MPRNAEHDMEVYIDNLSPMVCFSGSRGFCLGNEAEEMCIDHIRRFPSLYPNVNALNRSMFLENGTDILWTKKGTIGGLKSSEPRETGRTFAARVFAHTLNGFVIIPPFKEDANAFHVPDNATDGWLAITMRFFRYVLGLDERMYRLQLTAEVFRDYFPKPLNSWVASDVKVGMRDFREVRECMTAAAKAYGWTWVLPSK